MAKITNEVEFAGFEVCQIVSWFLSHFKVEYTEVSMFGDSATVRLDGRSPGNYRALREALKAIGEKPTETVHAPIDDQPDMPF